MQQSDVVDASDRWMKLMEMVNHFVAENKKGRRRTRR
jgi:hypothetical protein